jgi:hypothetical protein
MKSKRTGKLCPEKTSHYRLVGEQGKDKKKQDDKSIKQQNRVRCDKSIEKWKWLRNNLEIQIIEDHRFFAEQKKDNDRLDQDETKTKQTLVTDNITIPGEIKKDHICRQENSCCMKNGGFISGGDQTSRAKIMYQSVCEYEKKDCKCSTAAMKSQAEQKTDTKHSIGKYVSSLSQPRGYIAFLQNEKSCQEHEPTRHKKTKNHLENLNHWWNRSFPQGHVEL